MLGNSEFVKHCADGFLRTGANIAAIISLTPKLLPLNSYYLGVFAEAKNIPFHAIEDVNSENTISVVRSYTPDYIFASWPKLIDKSVLDIPSRFVIGTHPTCLPHNRGRHPLHWLMVQGYAESHLTFFRMDSGVDSGEILLQLPFPICLEDSIGDVAIRMNECGFTGARLLGEKLHRNPQGDGIPQNQTEGNYWRARTPHDVTLDFRLSGELLIRTVRSFTKPYLCANLLFRNHLLKIEKAGSSSLHLSDLELQRIEPGKVLDIHENTLTVKASDSAVVLTATSRLPEAIKRGTYIHPPSRYILEYPEVWKGYFS